MRKKTRHLKQTNKLIMSLAVIKSETNPEYSYHLFRSAQETFHKGVAELDKSQYQQAKKIADKTYALESIVLSSPEARDIVLPDARLDEAVQEISTRYENEKDFISDLEANGLDETTLRSAIYRELMFDAVMERVAVKTATVTDVDIQIFYQLHKDRFSKPETRKARHILVTVNDEFPENERSVALERIEKIYQKLVKNPGRFKILARSHSECPTAMEGGKLGEVKQGVLFPELDTRLFQMNEGEISEVIETEMGFHVLLCEKINNAMTAPLSRVKPKIKQLLQDRQRRACQKAWIDSLQEEKS